MLFNLNVLDTNTEHPTNIQFETRVASRFARGTTASEQNHKTDKNCRCPWSDRIVLR